MIQLLFEVAMQAFGKLHGLLTRGIGQGNHKLVPAKAAGGVIFAQGRAANVGGGLDHLVADVVALGVVDYFEVVEVEHAD